MRIGFEASCARSTAGAETAPSAAAEAARNFRLLSAETRRDEFSNEETVSPNFPAWIDVIPAKIVFTASIEHSSHNKINPVLSYITKYQGIGNHQLRYFWSFIKS